MVDYVQAENSARLCKQVGTGQSDRFERRICRTSVPHFKETCWSVLVSPTQSKIIFRPGCFVQKAIQTLQASYHSLPFSSINTITFHLPKNANLQSLAFVLSLSSLLIQ
jgi:hypothetical protein